MEITVKDEVGLIDKFDLNDVESVHDFNEYLKSRVEDADDTITITLYAS